MSIKIGLIKTAIKCTPNMMIIWVANKVLKGIAELTEFSFDLDARTAYVQATLYGETDVIEVSLDGYAVVSEGDSHFFVVQEARSNRLWLNNLLSRITEKAWKIPVIPQYQAYIGLIIELLQTEKPTHDEDIGGVIEAELTPEDEIVDSSEE
jgi:hypothetical protein